MPLSAPETKVMKLWWDHTTASLESLPVELQRNFSLMRDLDSKSQLTMQEIDRLGSELFSRPNPLSPERKREIQNKVAKLFTKSKALGDDKVQLAIQTYELVDKHIRRLDSDLARFETEIKNGGSGSGVIALLSGAKNARAAKDSAAGAAVALAIEQEQPTTSAKGTNKKRGRKRDKDSMCIPPSKSSGSGSGSRKSKVELILGTECGGGGSGSEGHVGSPARKKHRSGMGVGSNAGNSSGNSLGGSGQSELTLAAISASSILPSNSDTSLDMPVDPNEPTYCICQQVSYGEMIACDNPDCPIEWFHMTCMGIVTSPKGKWYCPKCSPPPANTANPKKK